MTILTKKDAFDKVCTGEFSDLSLQKAEENLYEKYNFVATFSTVRNWRDFWKKRGYNKFDETASHFHRLKNKARANAANAKNSEDGFSLELDGDETDGDEITLDVDKLALVGFDNEAYGELTSELSERGLVAVKERLNRLWAFYMEFMEKATPLTLGGKLRFQNEAFAVLQKLTSLIISTSKVDKDV